MCQVKSGHMKISLINYTHMFTAFDKDLSRPQNPCTASRINVVITTARSRHELFLCYLNWKVLRGELELANPTAIVSTRCFATPTADNFMNIASKLRAP